VREGHYEKATGPPVDLPPAAAPQVVDMSSQKMKAVKPAYEKPKKAKPKLNFTEIRAAIQRHREKIALAGEKEPTAQTTHKTKKSAFAKPAKMSAAAKRAAKKNHCTIRGREPPTTMLLRCIKMAGALEAHAS